MLGGAVAKFGEMLDEAELGDEAGLGEAVHAFPDFNHDKTVVYKGSKVVLYHNALWDGGKWDPHILVARHWGVKVEILYVHVHVARTVGRDDTVEVAFDGGEING